MSSVFKKTPDYSLVKSVVSGILKNNYITSPPINIVKLVQDNYGLNIKFAKFKDSTICGFLDINEKSIWVNAEDSINRQNFTIAHEFGHWMLHKDDIVKDPANYRVLFRQPIGGNKDYRESEANSFAGNLLVPDKMLQICKLAKFNSSQMSILFGVSEDVIGYRLQQEGLND